MARYDDTVSGITLLLRDTSRGRSRWTGRSPSSLGRTTAAQNLVSDGH
jgi:hypothetical protein